MNRIVKTQAEWDALPASFKEFTVIEIRSSQDIWIIVRKVPDNGHVVARESSHVVARESSHVVAWGSSHVVAWGSSHVEAWGSSHVVAWGSSHVEAWGSSHVEARGSSHVVAWGSSHVEARGSSHVVARESSHVEAWGSSHVVAWGSSHVVARESSHVEAWGSSHVVARESSHVVARESSHVVAWGSSHVVAWGSSHVEARGSSHVEARGSVSVSAQSEYSTLELSAFAVAILLVKVKKLLKKSKTCTVVEAHEAKPHDTKSWAEWNGAPREGNKVTLFKRVSKELKTQEDTENETTWTVGAELEVPNWNPVVECGAGKFHACFCASACDQYRSEKKDDRYIAIEVNIKDTHFFKGGSHPNKISFKKGKVLFECDRFGKRVN